MNNAVFTLFDDNYQKYVRASLNSLKANYPDHPLILACYDGSDPFFIRYLEEFENLKIIPYIDVKHFFDVINAKDNKELKCFSSLFLLWFDYFDEYDNILFLDMDTLILSSLKEIFFNEELLIVSDRPITPDIRIFKEGYRNNPDLISKLNEDGILYPNGMDDMANSGMYLLPKKYRNKETLKELIRLKNRYDNYRMFNDQSIISLFCLINDIEYSSQYEYNFMTPFYYMDFTDTFRVRYPGYDIPEYGSDNLDFLENIKILHFPGERKPDTDLFIQFEQIGKSRFKIKDLFHYYLNLK